MFPGFLALSSSIETEIEIETELEIETETEIEISKGRDGRKVYI